MGKRSLIGIAGAEQGQAWAGEVLGGWEPVSGSLLRALTWSRAPPGLVRHSRRLLGYRLFVPALCLGRTDGRAWAARPPASGDAADSAAGPLEAGDGVNLDAKVLGSAQALGGGKLGRAAAGGRDVAGWSPFPSLSTPGLCCRSFPSPATATSYWAWCAARDTPAILFPGSILRGVQRCFLEDLKGAYLLEEGGVLRLLHSMPQDFSLGQILLP